MLLLLTPVAWAVLSSTLSLSIDFPVLFSVSKSTFSTMYFDCEVSRLTPCPGRLAILCVGSSDEVDDWSFVVTRSYT